MAPMPAFPPSARVSLKVTFSSDTSAKLLTKRPPPRSGPAAAEGGTAAPRQAVGDRQVADLHRAGVGEEHLEAGVRVQAAVDGRTVAVDDERVGVGSERTVAARVERLEETAEVHGGRGIEVDVDGRPRR